MVDENAAKRLGSYVNPPFETYPTESDATGTAPVPRAAPKAKTGALIWNAVVGPGGDQGGFEWGTAYDGQRIYGSLTNQHHIPYDLTENGTLTSTSVTGGSWMALDPATGKILWQVADPQTETLPAPTGTVGVWDLAPVTVANGVVYTASMAKSGNEMYALGAATGPEGPGPIITIMAKTVGTFPIPVTIVPGNLSDEDIDALS